MAVKFLDYTGLGYFWSKIKAWCNATFAAITHNQASNTINAMTSYSKPSSGSAITTSDSLNTAIGKLEAKVDAVDQSNVVHRTGDETVAGLKSFTGWFNDSVQDASGIQIINSNLIRGAVPSITNYISIPLIGQSGKFGVLETAVNSQGDVSTYIGAYKNSANGDSTFLNLNYPANGDPYLQFDKLYIYNKEMPWENDATKIWYDTIMHRTESTGELVLIGGSRESIYSEGAKLVLRGGQNYSYNGGSFVLFTRNATDTPNKDIYLEGHADGYLRWTGYFHLDDRLYLDHGGCVGSVKVPNTVKGTAPSSSQWTFIEFTDADGARYGYVGSVVANNKANRMQLTAYKNIANNGDGDSIGIGYDNSDKVYTFAPTPSNTDNSTCIATTAWVRIFCDTTKKYLTSHQSLDSCVKTSGAQTVSGAKTFTSAICIKTGNSAALYQQRTDLAIGTVPSSATSNFLKVVDKNGTNLALDNYYVNNTVAVRTCAIKRFGSTNTEYTVQLKIYHDGSTPHYEAQPDNTVTLGQPYYRWKQLYAGTTTISTSDERLKQNIEIVPDNILDVWEDVSFCQFRMKDAVEEKSNNARLHNGLIAQQIEKVFASKGLNASDYGLFCYDSWEHKDALIDEKGSVLEEEILAGDRYSLRYEEALCMEAAYQRRKNKILENRISELEKQVSDMLTFLQNLTNGNG